MIDHQKAVVWLLADMLLTVSAISLVKSVGLDVHPSQIVFIRSLTGLTLILPWAWAGRQQFSNISQPRLHTFRIVLSVVALSCGYYAVSRLPLALFTTINFIRPLILMIMAVVFLKEMIQKNQWGWAGLGFLGIAVAANPTHLEWSTGLPVLFIGIFAGTGAIIITRKLIMTSPMILMVFYTGGLTVAIAPFAYYFWLSLNWSTLLILIAVGLLAQCAQFAFLKAHRFGDAGILGPMGYLSLVFSGFAGFFFFNEIPKVGTLIGAAIVIVATIGLTHSKASKSAV